MVLAYASREKIHRGRGCVTTRGRSRKLGSWEVTSLTANTEQRVNWEWTEPVNSQSAAVTRHIASAAGDPEFKHKSRWRTLAIQSLCSVWGAVFSSRYPHV